MVVETRDEASDRLADNGKGGAFAYTLQALEGEAAGKSTCTIKRLRIVGRPSRQGLHFFNQLQVRAIAAVSSSGLNNPAVDVEPQGDTAKELIKARESRLFNREREVHLPFSRDSDDESFDGPLHSAYRWR